MAHTIRRSTNISELVRPVKRYKRQPRKSWLSEYSY